MSLEEKKARFAQPGNEAAVLACVLKDPAAYFEVEAKLAETDFLSPQNKALWVVIKHLMREGVVSLDIAAIMSQATALKVEDTIHGYEYVSALTDKIVDPANLQFYIKKLTDASIKYKMVCALEDLEELVEQNKTLTGETLDADTLVASAQDTFLRISLESARTADAVNLYEGIPELLAAATENPSDVRGLSTGFPRLDKRINGLEKGTLTVVGARAKVGKSSMLLGIAAHIAYTLKLPVLYLDTEMRGDEQRFRLLSMLSGVPERIIKSGKFKYDAQQVASIAEAERIISSGLIFHKYYPEFTPEGIASITRKYKHQYGIGCLLFDYIKLAEADVQMVRSVREDQALGYLCVALKNLAGQLEMPVLTAAQIGRTGAEGRIKATSFADSDRILRYANTLLGLSRKTKEEMATLKEEQGVVIGTKMGTHRLQILETRGGGSLQTGLDIMFRKDILEMREAEEQLYERTKKEEQEEETDGL